MTLSEFLLARIAEDEAVASDWPDNGYWGMGPTGDGMWTDTLGRPIWAPKARALAECEAKRRIVETRAALKEVAAHLQSEGSDGGPPAHGMAAGLEVALSALAYPYANHPDYNDEWRDWG